MSNYFTSHSSILQQIQQTALIIEEKLTEQNGANKSYSAFTELIHSEISENLKRLHTRTSEHKSNNLKHKKYWNGDCNVIGNEFAIKNEYG